MKHSIVRLPALAAAMMLAGAALAAPQATTGTDAVAGKHHGSKHRGSMMLRLDTNQDGAIDRAEAAAHPRLAEKFDQLDRNGDGKLERSEFRRGHGQRNREGGRHMMHKRGDGHSGMRGGFARYLALDVDGDGRISKVEASSSPLAESFDRIDRNRDGYLVLSELRVDRERRRAEFAKQAAERFDQRFKQADSNGDGRLSRAEYEAAWPKQAKMFVFLDEDRDGYLDRTDLAPLHRR